MHRRARSASPCSRGSRFSIAFYHAVPMSLYVVYEWLRRRLARRFGGFELILESAKIVHFG